MAFASAIQTGQIKIALTSLDYTLLEQETAQTSKHNLRVILTSRLAMGTLPSEQPNQEEGLRCAGKQHPGAKPKAHVLWPCWRARDANVRHLALQVYLVASFDGIVLFGLAYKQ